MNYNTRILINKSRIEGKFQLHYTKPLAYFLSLLSNVDMSIIEAAQIYKRTPFRFLPWYKTLHGGGAITLGSEHKANITFTENFYSDDYELFKNKAYLNNLRVWIRLSSHEVMHLEHAKRFKYLLWYLIVFAYEYLRYGHDLSPLEIEANRGCFEYDIFIHFTRYDLGIEFLKLVFDGKMNEEDQIKTIEEIWKAYQLSKSSN